MGKEHLSGLDAVTAEMFFIGLRKPHLSHRGGGLKLTNASRSSFPADTKHALGNSARAHQEHFAAHRAERGNLTGPALDRTNIKTASVIGNQCAPNLDNNATRLFKKRFLTDHGVFSYGNCTTGKPLTHDSKRLSGLKLMFQINALPDRTVRRSRAPHQNAHRRETRVRRGDLRRPSEQAH